VVVRFLQAVGASQSEIHCRLVTVYGQKVLHRKEASFCGITNLKMAERH
jgi:hypothetical protein